VTNADSDKLTYAYDDVGNLATVIDPKKTASADPNDFTAIHLRPGPPAEDRHRRRRPSDLDRLRP
jgi:hypothetical protein